MKSSRPPISQAVVDDDLYTVATLLNADPALIGETDGCGWTALHWAASNRRVDIAQLLLSRGANPNARGESLETPLHLSDCPHVTALLLEAGADPAAVDSCGMTPLTWATIEDNPILAAMVGPDDDEFDLDVNHD